MDLAERAGPDERREEKLVGVGMVVVDFWSCLLLWAVPLLLPRVAAWGPRRELSKADRLDRAIFMRLVSWSWSAALGTLLLWEDSEVAMLSGLFLIRAAWFSCHFQSSRRY